MKDRLRVVVDSNIVFSATQNEKSTLLPFWTLPDADILISQYIIGEVSRHFPNPHHRGRLWHLVSRSHLIQDGEEVVLPSHIHLPVKDEPVLQCAIASRADILVTGDLRHFGPIFGMVVAGVLVESTEDFKRRYPLHFPAKEGAR